MPFFSGFAGAFGESLTRQRQEEADRAERRAQREQAFFQHMATADDPAIKAQALIGMSQLAQGKPSKGLRGFLGEMEEHPAMPRLRDLIQQAQTPAPEAPPEGQVPPSLAAPPEPGAAALPATSLTQGGPPMRGAGAPPGPVVFHPQGQIWLSPEERIRRNEEAQISGQLSGFRSAWAQARTPEEQALVRAKAGIHTPYTGQFVGNTQRNGQWFRQMAYIDPSTGNRSIEEIPIAAPTALQRPTYQMLVTPQTGGREVLHRTYPGQPPEIVTGPSGQPYTKEVKQPYVLEMGPDGTIKSVPGPVHFQQPGMMLQEPEGGWPQGGGVATAPPPTRPQVWQPGGFLPPVGGSRPTSADLQAPPGPPPGSPAGATTPEQRAAWIAELQAGGPRSTPATGGAPSAPAPVAQAPPPGPSGERIVKRPEYEDVPGAILDAQDDVQAVVGKRLKNDTTGKIYHPQHLDQEFTGFIPGAMGQWALTTHQQGRTALDTAKKALEALEATGIANNPDPQAMAQVWQDYKTGKYGSDNPLQRAVGLQNLASIQGAGQFVRSNSRSLRMFEKASAHTPIMPSNLAAGWTGTRIIGRMVTPGGSLMVGGEGWDSGQSAAGKLRTMIEIYQQGLDDLKELTGKVPERAVGAGGGAPETGATPAATEPPPKVPALTPVRGTPDRTNPAITRYPPGTSAREAAGAAAPAAKPAAHPNSALPDGTEFTGPDGKVYIKTGTNPDGTVRGRLKARQAAPPARKAG